MKKEKLEKNENKKQYNSDSSTNNLTKLLQEAQFEEALDQNLKATNVKNPNRGILLITYIFIGLFVLLMGYFVWFLIADSDEIINSSYNKRQDLLATRVVRGEIRGNDAEIIAYTNEDDGESTRVYPYDNMFAHVVGRFEKGKAGIEASENFNLLASHTNPITMLINELAGKKNISDNIVTTLDIKLQEIAYNALEGRKGAIVVLEPSTGKILAMVSKPDYDPNKIVTNWDELTKDSEKDSSLINRATQGLYPPGSTFKILTALEYIQENPDTYQDYSYECTGQDIFNNVKINCYNNEAHGKVDLSTSLSESCNTSFANIGTKLNMDTFKELNQIFLMNRKLPINIPYKQSSFVLNSSSDKSLIPQTAIGQGNTLISPFHNALIVSAIANGGTLMNPYVVDHMENYSGIMVKKNIPSTYGALISTKEAKIITDMMSLVVSDGTGRGLKDLPVTAAGKTGSAEYNSGKSSHAWFVGFAPTDKPQLVVSIIVEGAGTGSSHAVPIAKELFSEYFNR